MGIITGILQHSRKGLIIYVRIKTQLVFDFLSGLYYSNREIETPYVIYRMNSLEQVILVKYTATLPWSNCVC